MNECETYGVVGGGGCSACDSASAPWYENRFWVVNGVDSRDGNADVDGWYGVVDEREGGIVAYAGTAERAAMIRDLFAANPEYK